MKKILMCVRDRAANAFIQPFTTPHVNLAMRGFKDAVQKGDSNLALYPHDHELWELGTFDDETGKTDTSNPRMIATAIEYMPLKHARGNAHAQAQQEITENELIQKEIDKLNKTIKNNENKTNGQYANTNAEQE